MAQAASQLFYGLCVQTSDLIAAARAFPKLAGPLRALELIQLRRARATLRTKFGSRKGAVKRVPAEVWAMVGRELIAGEVESSRVALVEQQTCDDCGGPNLTGDWRGVKMWELNWIDAPYELHERFCEAASDCQCFWSHLCTHELAHHKVSTKSWALRLKLHLHARS